MPMVQKLLSWLDIRFGEIRKTGSTALFFFLIIFSVTVVKPVRNSLFLTEVGAVNLPYIYLGTALVTGILVFVDSRLSRRFHRTTVMSLTLGFLLVNLLLFWWLLKQEGAWVSAVFYIWVAFFSTLAVAHFWSFANDYFNPREAKRLFGVIGTGGILGGIAGGLAADFTVQYFFSTENVLLIAAATLLLAMAVVQYIERAVAVRPETGAATASYERVSDDTSAYNYRWLLRLLGLVVVIEIVVSTLVDYQFNSMVERTLPTQAARTQFFGTFFAVLSFVSLVVQVLLTSRILKKFGLWVALIAMPVLLALGSAGFVVLPTLLMASALKVSDKSLNYSLYQTSRELVFLPIPSRLRMKAKLFIDVFLNRLASAVGAGLILFLTFMVPVSLHQLSYVVIVLLLGWVVLARFLREEYVLAIKSLLMRRDVDIEEEVIKTLDAETIEALKDVLDSKNEKKVRYALSLLELVPSGELIPHLKPLLRHWDAGVRAHALRVLFHCGGEELFEVVQPLLRDENIDVRIEAIHFICGHARDALPSESMARFILDPDPQVKASAVACMINHTGRLSPEGESALLEMLGDSTETGTERRKEAARSLGIIRHGFGLHENLMKLLNDAVLEVQKVAIESAGKVRHEEFVDVLMSKLQVPALKATTRQALANYGDAVLDRIRRVLENKDRDRRVRKSLPNILYRINTTESRELLLSHLQEQDNAIRYEVIKSLNKMRRRTPELRFDEERIREVLMRELQHYYRKLNLYHGYRPQASLHGASTGRNLLRSALAEKLEEGLERAFRLLALVYPQEDMYRAYYHLTRGFRDERSNALEFLDNVLSNPIKEVLFPLVDGTPLQQRVVFGRSRFGLVSIKQGEVMPALLREDEDWLVACTIYMLTRERMADFREQVAAFLRAENPILRETAEKYFRTVHPDEEVFAEKTAH